MKKYQALCFAFLFSFFASSVIAQTKKEEKPIPGIQENTVQKKMLKENDKSMDADNLPQTSNAASQDPTKGKPEPVKTFNKPEKVEKPKIERESKPEKPEKVEKPEKPAKADKYENRPDKPEKPAKTGGNK